MTGLPESGLGRFEWTPGRYTTLQVDGDAGRVVLLAHGAGTNQHHRLMADLAAGLAGEGLTVVRFDYPYTSEGRKAPDRAPVLIECHRAVFMEVWRRLGEAPVLAGRSMGGRIGSMLAASGAETSAVIAYGYPLHPPGRPDRLRIEHLPAISVPMLFVRGERDALSRADLFDLHIRSLPGASVLDIPAEDHSLRKPGTGPLVARATKQFIDRI